MGNGQGEGTDRQQREKPGVGLGPHINPEAAGDGGGQDEGTGESPAVLNEIPPSSLS